MEVLFDSSVVSITLVPNLDNCELIAIHIVVYDDLWFDLDLIKKCQTGSFSFHPLTPMETDGYLNNLDMNHNEFVHLRLKHKDYSTSFRLWYNNNGRKKTTKTRRPSVLPFDISDKMHRQISSPDDWCVWIYVKTTPNKSRPIDAFGVEFAFVLVWWWGRCGHGWLIACCCVCCVVRFFGTSWLQ